MEDFIITVNYQQNDYKVKVSNQAECIKDILDKIVTALNLKKIDGEGNPVIYHLGMMHEDGNIEILKTRVKGEEKTLMDYNVKNGDRLALTMIPIAG